MQNQYYWALTDEEYIAHHGILGQKWGIRRYQNPDGSLTTEGKKHVYGAGASGGLESNLSRNRRIQKSLQYSKKVESAEKKLVKSLEKGDAEKVQKNKENLSYLKKTRDIYMKDLSKEELELGEKWLQNNQAEFAGWFIGGPIAGIAAYTAMGTINGTWETAKIVDEQRKARRQKYIEKTIKSK